MALDKTFWRPARGGIVISAIGLGSIGFFFLFVIFYRGCSLYADDREFQIVLTGQDLGSLEPCGCSSGQWGGLSRRHTLLRSIQSSNIPTMILSTGDLSDQPDRLGEIKFQTQIQSMNLMGYHAVGLGEKDLMLGVDFIQSLIPLMKFRLIASNITQPAGETVFDAVFVLNLNHFRIHVLNILSGEYRSLAELQDLKWVSPQEVLARELKSFPKKESWIVIFHGSLDEARILVENFPKINIMIVSHDVEEPKEGVLNEGETQIVFVPRRGKHVLLLKEKIDAGGRPRLLSYGALPLDEKVSHSEEVDDIFRDYQNILGQERLDQEVARRTVQNVSYVGSSACRVCHTNAYEKWSQSRHAEAFKTLDNLKRAYDPDCLICHSTGFRYQNGFRGEKETSHLALVGCESCHGPGENHVKEPLKNILRKVTPEKCIECHDSENSPQFDYVKYWPRITHGKDSGYSAVHPSKSSEEF